MSADTLLKPGDLPRPLTRKERQRLARIDHAGLAYERPVDDPDAPDGFDRCHESKYQTHRFVLSGGTTRCEFCGRAERECRRPR